MKKHAKYHALAMRWTSFRGAKATDVLNGLVTNDVSTLAVGASQLAAALSPKGKLVCDMYIVRLAEDALLTGVVESVGDAWQGLVRKYVNPRLCTVADESPLYHTFGLFGDESERVAQKLREDALPLVALTPLPGAASAQLLLARVDANDDVLAGLARTGVTAAAGEDWQVARIEAGLPLIGVDMDESTIPQEANLDALGAISFTKGCYTGQETVARIHFRGHVNRHLRGLTSETLLVRGQVVVDATGKPVGDVRSSTLSPTRGPIAIAMVRREVSLGDLVQVEGPSGSIPATVHALPFPSGPLHQA
ncbi:MAG TPA: glycine cleavage T C-terminal barrel domain-containing protein [Gemmatimonas sp.]|nr:glycine cleavage T C-terminal barrel domain-containing protein [Gemmatimonas sp.]